MKIFPFAALLATSAVFLSCDGGTVGGSMCKIAAKGYEVPDNIKELDGYKELDPSCKTEQKKLVTVYDLYPKENDINWDYVYSHLQSYKPGSGNSVWETGGANSQGVYYNVNGTEMTQAEYDIYKAEYWRKYYEESEKNTRVLNIPCVIEGNLALLTDKEITELKKKYNYLAIEDYIEATTDGGSEAGNGYAGCGGK